MDSVHAELKALKREHAAQLKVQAGLSAEVSRLRGAVEFLARPRGEALGHELLEQLENLEGSSTKPSLARLFANDGAMAAKIMRAVNSIEGLEGLTSEQFLEQVAEAKVLRDSALLRHD